MDQIRKKMQSLKYETDGMLEEIANQETIARWSEPWQGVPALRFTWFACFESLNPCLTWFGSHRLDFMPNNVSLVLIYDRTLKYQVNIDLNVISFMFREAEEVCNRCECDIRDYGKKISKMECSFEETMEALQKANTSLEEVNSDSVMQLWRDG